MSKSKRTTFSIFTLPALAALAVGLSAAGIARAGGEVTLLNVSYDPTRELWRDLNANFAARYEKEKGVKVNIKQSHGGSSTQARSVIDGLDADVTSIESARSRGRILGSLDGFGRGLGPGVYDIHSPRVPSVEEVGDLVRAALEVLPAERVWINPDCGLKTRTYDQVEAALTNVVAAARQARGGPRVADLGGRWPL